MPIEFKPNQSEAKPVSEGWEARREKLRTSFRDPHVSKGRVYMFMCGCGCAGIYYIGWGEMGEA